MDNINRSKKVKRICRQCSNEFWIIPSKIKEGRGKCCSTKCCYNYKRSHKTKSGYHRITINGKSKCLHVHIYEQYHNIKVNSRTHCVHHISGDRSDNSINNLQMLTHSRHASLHNRGEKHPRAKLNENDVKKIRKLLENGNLLQREIAKIYNMNQITISLIKRRKIWTHI